MKLIIFLTMLGILVLSEAIPAPPLIAEEIGPQQRAIRVARAPAVDIQSAGKDLEGSETAYGYGVYPYYYPYYSYYKYPYYVYGK